MANFPASVYAPAVKAAGQTIAAAFFNDPDGEITAIEDGYLNGTARLNSSNSTVANLSVTGGSTFASLSIAGGFQSSNSTVIALQVSSNSTFAIRPTMPPPDAALVFLNSTGAVGSSALSTLSFLSQAFVTNSSLHSTTTNPDRLTPQSTGIYAITAQCSIAGDPSAASIFRLTLFDSSASAIGIQEAWGVTAGPTYFQANGFKRFDVVGGYVTCEFRNRAGASTVSYSTGVTGTWLSLVKL